MGEMGQANGLCGQACTTGVSFVNVVGVGEGLEVGCPSFRLAAVVLHTVFNSFPSNMIMTLVKNFTNWACGFPAIAV